MPLESGEYYISSVSFASGEPVTRPLGQGHEASEIVVLPLNTPPPKWSIVKLDNGLFSISFGSFNARIMDGNLQLSLVRLHDFPWAIIRGAPSPPPIGNDSYGIFVLGQQPQQSWFIPSTDGDQAVEVPVTIKDISSSIVITPA